MRRAAVLGVQLAIAVAVLAPDLLAAKPLLRLKGTFFAYSYDLNHLYGENVEFEFLERRVMARTLVVNFVKRSFCAYGRVTLAGGTEETSGDEFWFSPKEGAALLITYDESILTKYFGQADEKSGTALVQDIREVTLERIRASMFYLTAQSADITRDYEVVGHQARLFVEGVESLGFRKVNMTSGLKRKFAGFSVNKIWYTRSQGLITSLSYDLEKEDRINAHAQVNYEEHTLAKDYVGMDRQFDVMTNVSASFNPSLNLALNANYNSSNLWNMSAFLNKKWSEKSTTRFDLTYNKPVLYKGEAWVGAQTAAAIKRFGEFAIGGRLGSGGQFLGNVSYFRTFFKAFGLLLSSSYNKMGVVGGGEPSRIWSSNVRVSFGTRLFDLATDYFLNRDLVGQRTLSQPRLTLALRPFDFYGGLLSFRLSNIFILNQSHSLDSSQKTFSDNLTFGLGIRPIYIFRTVSLMPSLSIEQFWETSRRNFTSGGLILSLVKEFGRGVTLEGYYSAQSRRKSQGWFVQGTTSQDLSLVFRAAQTTGFSGWISVSYDPERNEWRTSFAELSLRVFGAWRLHSVACYDFLFKKVNNVDFYLIREAGRFQLRFVWRSLSKQFVVELTPR